MSRAAELNVRSMLRVGLMLEIMKEAEKYKLDVVALQEIIWKEQTQNGITFMISSQIRQRLLCFYLVRDRMGMIRIKSCFNNILFINVYASTECSEGREKEFYTILQETSNRLPTTIQDSY
ncbi:hypothetical protein ILUMI_08816 [Ignelater luminosus]|uniref:Uncharacterized protein n=1 Tax=Ignelater luminosus TaxID=2038154 RepID=A0A8K0GAA5_IGNLU|nr:hypothetical protein ILUMI_08816 [Ignelater luminosus]